MHTKYSVNVWLHTLTMKLWLFINLLPGVLTCTTTSTTTTTTTPRPKLDYHPLWSFSPLRQGYDNGGGC